MQYWRIEHTVEHGIVLFLPNCNNQSTSKHYVQHRTIYCATTATLQSSLGLCFTLSAKLMVNNYLRLQPLHFKQITILLAAIVQQWSSLENRSICIFVDRNDRLGVLQCRRIDQNWWFQTWFLFTGRCTIQVCSQSSQYDWSAEIVDHGRNHLTTFFHA